MLANVRAASLAPIVALALAACPTDDGFRLPPDSMKACSDASECVLVELDCCDHCNGGTLTSVHRDHEATVRTNYANTGCGRTACTLRGCAPKVATCDQGLCGFAEAVDCAGLDAEACTANPQCTTLSGAPAAEYCAGTSTDWPVIAGCMTATGTCGGALTCGRNPTDGTTMVFPSTCLPAGWENLGGPSGPPCCP